MRDLPVTPRNCIGVLEPETFGFGCCARPAVSRNLLLLGVIGAIGCASPPPCDLGRFPETGCPAGEGCAVVTDERFIREDVEVFACVPGADSELTTCHLDLAARDVAFEPLVIEDAHPKGGPDLECHVEDPVRLPERIHGVGFTGIEEVVGSCEMAHALVDTVDDLSARGVSSIKIVDAYNCRMRKGTENISSHAFGWAIDIAVFRMRDGRLFTLKKDWEMGNPEPETEGGQFLYDAVHTWHDNGYWKRVMTPELNEAHENHVHLDLSPTQRWIK